jgi:hypothetical protein
MSTGTFDLGIFLKESKQTLLNPSSFFNAMKLNGGVAEPVVKGAVYSAAAALLYLVWDIFNIGGNGLFIFGGVYGFMGFIKMIVSSIAGMFIWALILLVFSNLCKGNTEFEANLRVASATMIIMPLSAFFGFLTFNPVAWAVISILLGAIGVWIIFHALTKALKCSASSSKLLCWILFGLIVLFSLLSMINERKYRQADYNGLRKEFRKELKKLKPE